MNKKLKIFSIISLTCTALAGIFACSYRPKTLETKADTTTMQDGFYTWDLFEIEARMQTNEIIVLFESTKPNTRTTKNSAYIVEINTNYTIEYTEFPNTIIEDINYSKIQCWAMNIAKNPNGTFGLTMSSHIDNYPRILTTYIWNMSNNDSLTIKFTQPSGEPISNVRTNFCTYTPNWNKQNNLPSGLYNFTFTKNNIGLFTQQNIEMAIESLYNQAPSTTNPNITITKLKVYNNDMVKHEEYIIDSSIYLIRPFYHKNGEIKLYYATIDTQSSTHHQIHEKSIHAPDGYWTKIELQLQLGTNQTKQYFNQALWVGSAFTSYEGGTPIVVEPEVIDLGGTMLMILSMPFDFISRAFDLTIFPNTPYQVNFSNLFKGIIALLTILLIIRLFTNGFSAIGSISNSASDRKWTKEQRQMQRESHQMAKEKHEKDMNK